MKKFMLSVAACALILSSCNSDDATNEQINVGNKVAFSTGVGSQTKATEMELPGLKTASLTSRVPVKLFDAGTATAYTAANNMYLQWNGSRWDIWTAAIGGVVNNNIEYNGAADFFSSYPATAGTFSNTAGVGKLDYTVKPVAEQEDLLIADKVASKSNGVVTLAYQHALSQINFAIKDDPKNIYYIKEISVIDAFNQSVWTYGTRTSASWGIRNGNSSYVYNIASSRGFETGAVTNDNATLIGSVNYKNLNNGFVNDDPINSSTDAAYRKTAYQAGNNGLMLMPQALTKNLQRIKIVVEKVTDLTGTAVTTTSGVDLSTTKEFYIDFYVPGADATYGNEWKKGLRYLYVLDMGAITGITNYISFDVIVTEWENYDWGGTPGAGTGEVDITTLTPLSIPDAATISTIPAYNTYTVNGIINYKANINWNFSTAGYSFPQLVANGPGSYFTLDFTNVQFVARDLDLRLTVPSGYSIGSGSTIASAKTFATTTSSQTFDYNIAMKEGGKYYVVIVKE